MGSTNQKGPPQTANQEPGKEYISATTSDRQRDIRYSAQCRERPRCGCSRSVSDKFERVSLNLERAAAGREGTHPRGSRESGQCAGELDVCALEAHQATA